MLQNLQQDLKRAQLQKNELEVSTLRMSLSEIKNAEIAKGSTLTEDEITSVLQKEVKKRREAALGFRQGGREEAALKEEAEARVLSKYLPAQLSDSELEKVVTEAILKTGAQSISDMGKVIGLVRSKVGATADPAKISLLVKEKLILNL